MQLQRCFRCALQRIFQRRLVTKEDVVVNLDQETANRINAMTPVQYKTYEDRLRRMAKRQGLVLMKSRTRDQRARDYCGYMLVDDRNTAVAGGNPNAYSMSIDEVEQYLTDPYRPGWRKGKDGELRWHLGDKR